MPKNNAIIWDGREFEQQKEARADEDLETGSLVDETATGITRTTTSGTLSHLRVAIDDRGMGMQQGDAYTSGANAKYVEASGPVGVHLRLAAGENVDDTTDLVPNGATAGTVRASTGTDTDDQVVAETEEAVDNSGGADPVYVAARLRT